MKTRFKTKITITIDAETQFQLETMTEFLRYSVKAIENYYRKTYISFDEKKTSEIETRKNMMSEQQKKFIRTHLENYCRHQVNVDSEGKTRKRIDIDDAMRELEKFIEAK